MSPLPPASIRYRSLQASQRALARAAPLVRFGLLAVGGAVFLDQVKPLISDAQFTWGERRVMGVVALVVFSSFGMAAWAAGILLKAASELIEVLVDAAEATIQTSRLLEVELVPNLARASAALERLSAASAATVPKPDAAASASAAAAVRKALDEGRFGKAARLLEELRRDHPSAADATALASALDRARRTEASDLKARLESARAYDDLERVADCRDALTQHLDGDALHALDARIVRWVARRIRARIQAGPIDEPLASLVERVADSFADTPEGRDLLAWLPELRRRAGLCPSCARPYRGPNDSCPSCLPPDSDPRPAPPRGGAAPSPRGPP